LSIPGVPDAVRVHCVGGICACVAFSVLLMARNPPCGSLDWVRVPWLPALSRAETEIRYRCPTIRDTELAVLAIPVDGVKTIEAPEYVVEVPAVTS
jgi:hypothetical protein